MDIKREELVNALEFLDMVTEVGGMASSGYIRVTQKKSSIEFGLASTIAGVVRVAGKVADEGREFYVDRKVFMPFVLVGKEAKGEFKSEVNNVNWMLKQGNRKADFVLITEKMGGYGQWLNRDKMKALKLPEEMKGILEASRRCASVDPSLPALNCVYLGGQSVMASNMTTVFVATLKNGNSLNFHFPPALIPLLNFKSVESVSIDGDKVIILSKYGHLESMVSAPAKKSFPHKGIQEQMNRAASWPVSVKMPYGAVKQMTERLETYISTVGDDKANIKIEISKGEMKMTVKVGHGTFVERSIGDSYSANVTLNWPLQLVKPVLDYIADKEKNIVVRTDEKKKTPYLISGADVSLLVARRQSK